MGYQANVLKVMIASPGDVAADLPLLQTSCIAGITRMPYRVN